VSRIGFPDLGAEHLRGLVDDIARSRGGVPDLYKVLLHAPPVAEGWLAYLSAIRQQASLPADLRELVIMQIAALNGAPYEAAQHRELALAAGLTETQLAALPDWSSSAAFDARFRTVLAYTDAMTLRVRVPDALFAEAASLLPSRELVELTATIAAYNMVSRFLEALQIAPEPAREPLAPAAEEGSC
jgi:AhpD family alkylhydroperoxidase